MDKPVLMPIRSADRSQWNRAHLAMAAALAVGGTFAAPCAHAADALGLVNIAVEGDTPATSELAAALRRGFGAGGFTVRNVPLDATAATCSQTECLVPLAKTYKANILAWAKVRSLPQSYDVEIRVLSAQTAEVLTVDNIKCAADDLCPPMPQTIQRLAKEAGRKVRARLAEGPPPAPVIADPVLLASPAPPVANQVSPMATFAPPRVYNVDENAQSSSIHPAVWLAGASVVTLGVSGIMFAYSTTLKDSADSADSTSGRSDLTGVAVAVGVAGLVGLGVATAWWLADDKPNHAASVALSPWADHQSAGVSLAGRWR